MRRGLLFLASALALAMYVPACGTSEDPSEPGAGGAAGGGGAGKACEPEHQRACTCPGGPPGTQTCRIDGSGYGNCLGCFESEAGAMDATDEEPDGADGGASAPDSADG